MSGSAHFSHEATSWYLSRWDASSGGFPAGVRRAADFAIGLLGIRIRWDPGRRLEGSRHSADTRRSRSRTHVDNAYDFGKGPEAGWWWPWPLSGKRYRHLGAGLELSAFVDREKVVALVRPGFTPSGADIGGGDATSEVGSWH
jgi:hypothetical protein